MGPDIGALASQAAARGNQQLQDYTTKAADYRGQFGNYQSQADAANKNVQNYTNYMQNEGSAGNQYDTAFTQQKNDLHYDPNQMGAARANLNQATGALSAYSDFANTAASKWGLNAGGFAAANAGALSGINNNIASNQNVVNGLSDLYKTAQTGANAKTGLVLQGEHETLGGLQATFTNAASQRDSAASMMNFYDKLASDQGGLNAQQQQAYGQAKAAYAAASASAAQAGLLMQQTNLARQQYEHQAQLYASQPAQANSDAMYAAMNHATAAQPQAQAASNGAGGYDSFVHRLVNINPQQNFKNWIGNAIHPFLN